MRLPLIVTKSVVRTTVTRSGDDLRSRKELDRWLRGGHIGRYWLRRERRNCYTYSPKTHGHLKHKVGGEYDQEVQCRILRHGFQNVWEGSSRFLYHYRQENHQREREEIWCI